jgi:hypothetical protein
MTSDTVSYQWSPLNGQSPTIMMRRDFYHCNVEGAYVRQFWRDVDRPMTEFDPGDEALKVVPDCRVVCEKEGEECT